MRLAKKFHAGQVRKGPKGEAFYHHPRRVCKGYLAFNNKSISGVFAALCHDLVEDTPLSLEELEEMFGADVRQIVFNLTKPPNISSEEYAEKICHWNLESKKIKLWKQTNLVLIIYKCLDQIFMQIIQIKYLNIS